MNPASHHANNGYRAANLASTSSQNYNDFLPHHINSPSFNNNDLPQQLQQQHSQHSDSAMSGRQILQEAYAMSAPVEAADEPFLLTKLLDASRRGESYKDSLNSMHGKNGHSASLWKDYYLDHKGRIDAWIAMCLQKEKEKANEAGMNGAKRSASSDVERVRTSIPSIKKPSPASFKREPSPPSRLSAVAPPVKRTYNKKVKHHSKRSTINSITAPAPVFGSHPRSPSRSPTPPTRYTPEDREYFIKFVGWRLKQNPSLTRNELCDLIAQKAPHHTAQSWASHWSNNHDVPDKILAAARGEEVPGVDGSSSEEESAPMARRPKYKDVTTSEEESGSEDEGDDDDDDDDDDVVDHLINDKPIRRYSETQMSHRGAAFNDADMYVTAKYISSLPNWDRMSSKDRWEPYGKKKMKKDAQGSSSIHTQCARPARTPPSAKRRRDFDFEFDKDSSNKRARS
ncbi:hypothetical protein BJ912DRAFT_941171 [Pholiota molesta]|nr:hypothetical protein BJ912DRAFT_941171 [Pholiota molesta]